MNKPVDPVQLTKEAIIRREYAEFCAEERRDRSPDTANIFAARKIGGGRDYLGYTEKQMILLLEGKLPFMYD